jgi:phosphoribosylglycinamide formyltransferase-1
MAISRTSIINNIPIKLSIFILLFTKIWRKRNVWNDVHQAVLENKEKETGITIHYVNEHYDEGEFIFQKSVNIEDCKTAEEIAEKFMN